MAHYKTDIVDIDLNTGNIHRSFMAHSIGHMDDDADRFGVRVFRGGVAEDLGNASCQAVFMAPDGQNIALTSYGTVSGNEAYVTLPQACYNVEGQFTLAIKLVGGGVTGTVRIVDGIVDRTGATGTVAPTSAVPTYQEVLAVSEQAIAAVEDVNDLKGEINDVNNWFADETGVKHYIFTKGGWIPTTTSSVDPTTVESNSGRAYCVIDCQEGDAFSIKASGVNSSHRPYSFIDASNNVLKQATSNITDDILTAPENSVKLVVNASINADYYCVKNNSRITKAENDILYNRESISLISEAGVNLFDVRQMDERSGVTREAGEFYGSASKLGVMEITGDYKANTQYTIQLEAYNENATGTSGGLTVYATYTDATDSRIIEFNRGQATYLQKYATTESGKTVSKLGFNYVNGGNDIWHVRKLQIEEGNIKTDYTDRCYSAVDQYARMTGDVLIPDGEDQTEEIYKRLSMYGHCRLGNGDFIVNNLIMPQGSTLSGCGGSSVIHLPENESIYALEEPKTSGEGTGYNMVYRGDEDTPLDAGLYTCVVNVTTEYTATTTSRIYFCSTVTFSYDASNVIATVDVGRGTDETFQIYMDRPLKSVWVLSGHVTSIDYNNTVSRFELERESTAVIMQKGCTVENLTFTGADEPIELNGEIGKRHAIGWFIPENQYGIIRGCRISQFDGSGILLQDTSTPTDHSVTISDCHIYGNMVGIYIRKNSEYNKVINCGITWNYYGCLNRGGNNIFSNCGFDRNVVGMQVDADEGNNQGHGSISNCTFNHTDNNTGYGLIVKGTGRELIGNSQFWYSNIRLQSTNGNIINGCEFGNDAVIEIAGSGSGTSCNMVIGCMMRSGENTVTIYNDIKSKVINCWTRDGNEVVPTTTDEPI